MSEKRNRKGFFSGVSHTRKVEIAGILIMAIAGLLLLSIVSYHPSDYAVVKSITSSTLFSPDDSIILRVNNWLGVVGAFISHMFVYVMFGYASAIIPLLVILLGWFIFRGKKLSRLSWPATFGIWTMVLFSTILGWFYLEFEWYSSVWSGNSGIALAQILQNITGIGSIVILSVFFLVTLLILIDRDLQKTVDAFKNGMNRWKKSNEEKRRKKQNRREEEIKARQNDPVGRGRGGIDKDRQDYYTGEEDSSSKSSIDEIVDRSETEDLERMSREKQEIKSLDQRQRVILEKSDHPEKELDSDEDEEFSVFIGEGDEEAEDKELDRQNKDKAKEVPVIKYKFPVIDLLDKPPYEGNEVDLEEVKENKRIILDKLKRHKIEILGINAIVGPTVTLYELDPAPDVKISKIESYANDLKMATAAHGLRIIA
ncbi:MAG: DNA translocase FtsK 4TM domain-containing protein, partial [Balneolaceae bacterium]